MKFLVCMIINQYFTYKLIARGKNMVDVKYFLMGTILIFSISSGALAGTVVDGRLTKIDSSHTNTIDYIDSINSDKYIITSSDGKIKLQRANDFRELFSLSSTGEIEAISADGLYVAISSENELLVYHSQFFEVQNRININSTYALEAVSFSSDNSLFAILYENGKLEIRNMNDFKIVNSVKMDVGIFSSHLTFNADNTSILIQDGNKITRFDLKRSKLTTVYSHQSSLRGISLLGDDTIITASKNKELLFVSLDKGVISRIIKTDVVFPEWAVGSKIKQLIVEMSKGLLVVFDVKNFKEVAKINTKEKNIVSINYSSNNLLLMFSHKGKHEQPNMYITHNYKKRKYNALKKDRIDAIAISHDQKFGVVGVRNGNFNIFKVWDFTAGKLVNAFIDGRAGYAQNIESIAISEDSQLIATASVLRGVKLYDTDTGILVAGKRNIRPESVLFTPNGNLLVATSEELLIMSINVETYTSGKQIKKHGYLRLIKSLPVKDISDFALLDDDTVMLSTGHNIQIWSISDEKLINVLTGHTGYISSLSVNKKNKLLVSTSKEDRSIKIWDLDKHTLIHTINDNKIYDAKVNNDGDGVLYTTKTDLKLYSLSKKKVLHSVQRNERTPSIGFIKDSLFYSVNNRDEINIHNYKSGELILSLMSFEGNSWASISPKGYFQGTNDTLEKIYYPIKREQGLGRISNESLFQKFYDPNFIKSTLNEKNININENLEKILANIPPIVKFTHLNGNDLSDIKSVQDSIVSKSNKINLTYAVSSEYSGGIGPVEIYQNGKRLSVSKGRADGEVEVELAEGNNNISVHAYNHDETIYSEKSTVNIEYTPSQPETRNMYALFIGANKHNFKGPKPLEGLKNSAKALEKIISNTSRSLYTNVYTRVLTDEMASEENILNELNIIRDKAKIDDVVFVHISAHGGAGQNDLFLSPYSKVDPNGVKFSSILNIVTGAKSLVTIITLEACKAGKAASPVEALETTFSKMSKKHGFHAIFSSGESEDSYGFEYQETNKNLSMGTFANELIDAFNNNVTDTNSDGNISIIELSKAMSKPIHSEGVTFTPVVKNYGADVDLVSLAQDNNRLQSSIHLPQITDLFFSNNGEYVLAYNEGRVYLFNSSNMLLIDIYETPYFSGADYLDVTNDGKKIIIHHGNETLIIDTTDGETLLKKIGRSNIHLARFFNDDKHVIIHSGKKIYEYSLVDNSLVNQYNIDYDTSDHNRIVVSGSNIYILKQADSSLKIFDLDGNVLEDLVNFPWRDTYKMGLDIARHILIRADGAVFNYKNGEFELSVKYVKNQDNTKYQFTRSGGVITKIKVSKLPVHAVSSVDNRVVSYEDGRVTLYHLN
jgi:WD40 repeat protein